MKFTYSMNGAFLALNRAYFQMINCFPNTKGFDPTSAHNTGMMWCGFHSEYFHLYYSIWNPVFAVGHSCMSIGSDYGKTKGLLARGQTGGGHQ